MTSKDDMERLKSELFRCCNDVQKFIFTLTRDRYAKEEVFQNTIVRAYESLGKLRDPDKMINWLFEIAKTETARHFRKEKRWNQFKQVNFNDITDEDFEEDMADVLEDIENKNEVLDCLTKLRPEYEEIIRAHYIYHISFVDLAKIWGYNYNTIKTFHNRALKELRTML